MTIEKSTHKKKKKRNPFWRTRLLRKSVQLLFFIIFLLTVIQARFPYSPWIPSELVLWLDPLAGLLTMISSRELFPWMLLSLIILFSPLIVGRSFCGWICPLGTLIDGTDRVLAPKKNQPTRKFRFLKTALLLMFLVLALAGIQESYLLDPLPLLWRSFTSVILPVVGGGFAFAIDGMLDIGIDYPFLFDTRDFISQHVATLDKGGIRGAVAVGIMFLVVIGVSRFSRRFWCRNLCPLGALLGLISKFSPFQRIVDIERCTSCALCSEDCKMDAIEEDFASTEKSECIFCLNCSISCNRNSTTYRFRSLTDGMGTIDLGRRSTLAAVSLGAAGAGSLRWLENPENRSQYCIRPPGSKVEEEFLDRCIRCNECVRVCSSTGNCLQPLLFDEGIRAFWSPVADFQAGYCEFTCNLCGEVCPTGAILPIELALKQRVKMGLAVIDRERCFPWKDKENCIVCEEFCPTSPKAILFEEEILINEEGEETVLRKPYVKKGWCIGCGICEKMCPTENEPAIRITRKRERRIP